jgi:hypothetical protein
VLQSVQEVETCLDRFGVNEPIEFGDCAVGTKAKGVRKLAKKFNAKMN